MLTQTYRTYDDHSPLPRRCEATGCAAPATWVWARVTRNNRGRAKRMLCGHHAGQA